MLQPIEFDRFLQLLMGSGGFLSTSSFLRGVGYSSYLMVLLNGVAFQCSMLYEDGHFKTLGVLIQKTMQRHHEAMIPSIRSAL